MLPTLQTILSDVKDSLVSASSNNIVNGISIYQQTGGPSTPWNWNQYYKYLSLKGLESTNFFRSEIADLTNNQQQIINPNEFLLYNQYNSNGAEDISKSCVN